MGAGEGSARPPAADNKNESDAEDIASRNALVQAKKSPPPETPEAIRLRTLVICSFWGVIISLGFPMWWQTNSIYRARLTLQEMMKWAYGNVTSYMRHNEL